MKIKYLLFFTAFCLFVFLPQCVTAADKSGKMREGYMKFDNSIRRFLMGGMDSTYVTVPATSWELPILSNIYAYNSSVESPSQKLLLDTDVRFEAGLGIGYHGLDLVYTQAIGKSSDFNFQIDYYDNYWGLGVTISRENYGQEVYGGMPNTTSGDYELKTRAVLVDGYVAVFGSRYSYPAARYGNYIQKKSAGSPIVSFWYEHRDYYPQTQKMIDFFGSDQTRHLNEGAVTAGYGYNFSINEGKAVINATVGVGLLLPYCGLATNGRITGMAWISDNFRFTFNLVNFFQKSWSQKDYKMMDNTWRAQVGFVYCFGRNGGYSFDRKKEIRISLKEQ